MLLENRGSTKSSHVKNTDAGIARLIRYPKRMVSLSVKLSFCRIRLPTSSC